jgi:hypothetical protein
MNRVNPDQHVKFMTLVMRSGLPYKTQVKQLQNKISNQSNIEE